MNITQTQTFMENETVLDPLEIKEEITFEDEKVEIKIEPNDNHYVTGISTYDPDYSDHTYVKSNIKKIKKKSADIIQIVNVNNLLKINNKELNTNLLVTKREPSSSTSENLNNIIKKEPCEDCMKNIEQYCIVCKKSWNYNKNITSCSQCHSAFKLQCRLCYKRYKFLNSVHQYVLQASKKLNLLSSEKKEVKFTCEKKQNFVCSKCKYKTTHKDQLQEHMKNLHGQIDILNEATAIVLSNNDNTNVINVNQETAISNSFIKSESESAMERSNISDVENSVTTLSELSTNQRKAKAKAIKNREKSEELYESINCNEDDDQFIELFCSICKKTCKRAVYDEIIKQVCRECQQLMLYRCILCTNAYKVLRNVRNHVKSVCWHRVNGTKLNCKHCDYKADVKSRLEFHVQSEHSPRNCPKCNLVVENTAVLKQHVMLCESILNSKPDTTPLPPIIKTTEADLDDVPLIIRQRDLILKSTLKQKQINSMDNYDKTYKIIKNDPDVLINQITEKPQKDRTSAGWRTLVDYYCLLCDGVAKKKFSRYKPRCPKCKIKYDYRCLSCEKLYGGYSTIYKHVKDECQNRFAINCSICNYTNIRKYLLLKHIKNKHTVYKCLRCKCRCEGYLSLRKHQLNECKLENLHDTMHVKNFITLYCKHCYRRCRKSEDYNDAVPCEKCKITMNFQCLKCNNIFDNREVVYKHVEKECKPKFQCKKCDYKAYLQYDIDIHLKYVHTERRCPDCNVQFKDEYIFRLHRIEELRKKELRDKLQGNILPNPKRFRTSKK